MEKPRHNANSTKVEQSASENIANQKSYQKKKAVKCFHCMGNHNLYVCPTATPEIKQKLFEEYRARNKRNYDSKTVVSSNKTKTHTIQQKRNDNDEGKTYNWSKNNSANFADTNYDMDWDLDDDTHPLNIAHHAAFHIPTQPEDAGSFVKASTFAEFLQYEPPDDTSDVSMDERWSHVRIETAMYAQHDNVSHGSSIDDVVVTTASDHVIPEASKAIYVSPDTTGIGAAT